MKKVMFTAILITIAALTAPKALAKPSINFRLNSALTHLNENLTKNPDNPGLPNAISHLEENIDRKESEIENEIEDDEIGVPTPTATATPSETASPSPTGSPTPTATPLEKENENHSGGAIEQLRILIAQLIASLENLLK